MRRKIFIRTAFQSIIFAALLLLFSSNIFGQSAATQGCAEADNDCRISKLNKEIQLNPNNANAFYERGIFYYHALKYDLALADFDRAISLNPKFHDAYYWRGSIHIEYKFYADAIRDFKRARALDPKDSDALVSITYIYEMIRRGGLPIEEYDNLIQLEPTNADFYYKRAELYFGAKRFNEAVEDASKAIELDPKYIKAYAVRSDSYCFLRKPKESNADIAKYEGLTGKKTNVVCDACDENFIDCDIRYLTAQIALEMKKEVPARLSYLYDKRGDLYYSKGDFDNALADFNKTEDKEGNITSPGQRGDIYLRKGKYDEALFDFKRYLKFYPNSVKINFQVGEIYFTKRDYEAAFKYFDTVIFLNTGNSEARLNRAAIYLERAEKYAATGTDEIKTVEAYKNALEDFNSVIKNNSKDLNPKVYLKRADVYEKLGETEKADADRAKYQELVNKP